MDALARFQVEARTMPQVTNEEMTVRGEIVHMIYANEKSDWVVLRLSGGEKAAGTLPAPQFNVEYEFTGRWETTKYGPTFKFSRAKRRLPTSVGAIRSYLEATCPGVGPVIATQIVDVFGLDAIAKCKGEPETIAARIKGISPERARIIANVLRQGEEDEALDLALRDIFDGVRVPSRTLARIKKDWGHSAPDKIRENAYALIAYRGIGFPTADKIALKLGYARDGVFRVRAGISYVLDEASGNGHVCLPRGELTERAANLLEVAESRVASELDGMTSERAAVVQDGSYIYSRTMFDAEEEVARRVRLLLAAPQVADQDLFHFLSTGDLYPDQANALQLLARSPVSILTGCPGTGKTYTLRKVIEGFTAAGLRIAIAAPTGKAARRVTELTGYPATTIHRLLEPQVNEDDGYVSFSFARNATNPVDADVVILDEVSMLDISLAASLLRALRQGTRLILVGDIHQLPSVGPGSVLKSLIESSVVASAELTEIKRQNPGLIVLNCHAIKDGWDIQLGDTGAEDFYFMRKEDAAEVRDLILDLYFTRLPAHLGIQDPLHEIQIICPRRDQTELAAKKFNEAIQARLHVGEQQRRIMLRDKVIQTRNVYAKDETGAEVFVANGDIGFVEKIEGGKIVVKFELPDRVVAFDAGENDLDLAYALTVHKYQGSEARVIVMPIHSSAGPKVQQRNLLYTAISRARELCVLVGQRNEVPKIVARNEQLARYTRLAERLRNGDEVKK